MRNRGSWVLALVVLFAFLPEGARADVSQYPIAFASNGELYLISSDGSGLHRLTHSSRQEDDPAWSPDHASIAYDVGRQIWTIRADGSGAHRIASIPDSSATIAGLSWSPDRTRI